MPCCPKEKWIIRSVAIDFAYPIRWSLRSLESLSLEKQTHPQTLTYWRKLLLFRNFETGFGTLTYAENVESFQPLSSFTTMHREPMLPRRQKRFVAGLLHLLLVP